MDLSGQSKEMRDGQNSLASLSGSPRFFGERVQENVNDRRFGAANFSRKFPNHGGFGGRQSVPRYETFEETTELARIDNEKTSLKEARLHISQNVLREINQKLPKDVGVQVLNDLLSLQREQNAAYQIDKNSNINKPIGFVKSYRSADGRTFEIDLQAIISGEQASAITNPPRGERMRTPQSKEEQKMNESMQKEKADALKNREEEKWNKANEKWNFLEDGVTDSSGEPYMYKKYTFEKKDGNGAVKKEEKLFAYSKNGGMEVMDPETKEWRKPTEEEYETMKSEDLKKQYQSMLEGAKKDNPALLKDMNENRVLEMFLRDPRSRSKDNLQKILNSPQWTERSRDALQKMKNLVWGRKTDSPDSLKENTALQSMINNLPDYKKKIVQEMIISDPEWRQGTTEEKMKVIAFIHKISHAFCDSLFSPQNLTDNKKQEISQNLQSLNSEEFKAIEMLLDTKSIQEMIDRLKAEFPSFPLVLNQDLQALIKSEVSRRKTEKR